MPGTTQAQPAGPGWTTRRWPARVVLSLATPLLLRLSFPDHDQAWLAWIALVPLLLACRTLPWAAAGAIGHLAGALSVVAVFSWIFVVPGFRPYHMILASTFFGVFPALWCAAAPAARASRLPAVVTLPALWVALDFLKVHAGFLALPWATLAQSQHAHPVMLQTASFAGEYGPTFLVVMANVAVAELVATGGTAWRPALATGLGLAAAAGWGTLELARPAGTRSIRLAAVQPSILLSERETDAAYASSLDRMETLTRRAARSRPALIAWPETAVRNLANDRSLLLRLGNLAEECGAALLVGASDHTKFNRAGTGEFEAREFNAAYLLEPGGRLAPPYRKHLLVPFGEYLPYEFSVPWPTWLVPRLFKAIPGPGPTTFVLADATPVSVMICWENLFAAYVREMVGGGAGVLVHISNDNWFERTPAARQHNAASVVRAIESRRPVLVASNTGPSLVVDACGRVAAGPTPLFSSEVVVADVRLGGETTFYTRVGDLFAWLAVAAAAAGLFDGLVRAPRPSGPA